MTREEAKREILFSKREVMADSWIDKAYDMAIQALSEPERKKGKWIRDAVWFTRYHCSQCGEKTEDTIMGEPRYKWCPMCGADMRGEKE